MSLQFYVSDVQFNGDGSANVLNKQISYTFTTDIKNGNAALQEINFSYDNSQRYVRIARMGISNVQINGPTISCSVEVELREDRAKEPFETSSARVLFIADCE